MPTDKAGRGAGDASFDPDSFVKDQKLRIVARDRERYERQIANARRDAVDEREMRREAQAEIDTLRKRLDLVMEFQHYKPPEDIKPKRAGPKKEATLGFVASDWHVEEKVDPRTINGLNVYTPAIAQKRGGQFFESILQLLELFRNSYTIKQGTVSVLGDIITGHIHEDLRRSNFMSPTRAVMLAMDIMIPGFELLIKESGLQTIHVPCCYGNHGRINPQALVQTGAEDSYEWLMYQMLAHHFRNESKVRFYVSEGYHIFQNVYGYRIRHHHGDWVRYQGGVGGLSIPLNKKIAKWNEEAAIAWQQVVAFDVLGHYHTLADYGNAVCNGSLIGYNAYAKKIAASPEPPQQAFYLVQPGRGKTFSGPVFVTHTKDFKKELQQGIKVMSQHDPAGMMPGAF